MLRQDACTVSRRGQGLFRWYYLASIFFLLQTIGAFGVFSRLVYGEWDSKPGDKITQGCNLLGMIVSILLLLRARCSWKSVKNGGCLVLGLAVFLTLSVVWSVDPQTTFRRGILFFFFACGVVGVAGNLDIDEFMGALGVTCFMCAAGSILLLAVSPANAWMSDGAGMCGIFSHKNVFGQVLAVGVLASLYNLRAEGGKRLPSILMLVIYIVLAVLARSTTSQLTIALYCISYVILALFRRGGAARAAGMLATAILAPAAVFVILFPDLLLETIGKDPTLTGRTVLWQYVLGFISDRPLLGWGLTAFWSSSNPLANNLSALLGWHVPEAHNGLLEILLEVGMIGTAFFLLILVRNVLLAIRCLHTSKRDFGTIVLLCYIGILLEGVSEQVLIDPSQASVSLFFIAGLLCEKTLSMARRGSVAGPEPVGVVRRIPPRLGPPARARRGQ